MMKSFDKRIRSKQMIQIIFLLSLTTAFGQNTPPQRQKSDFWEHVQFGGAFALNLGSGYTEITIAPGAIYNFNPYFALGTGLQGTYISANSYDSTIFGGSVIALFNPIREIQLSAELEELHITSNDHITPGVSIKDDYWNTGLFLGLGYRANNVTIGFRYNVLFNSDKNIYGDAFMPFIRAYF